MKKLPTRDIPVHVQCFLWGKAAGRCQFPNCPNVLWKSHVTGEQVNAAEKAHIYSFSVDGPRGHGGIADEDLNEVGNLLLVCHTCHKTIDAKKDGGRYTPELLKSWKAAHESRVERVTAIDVERHSHVIHYTASIAGQPPTITKVMSYGALLDHGYYPATDEPILIGGTNVPTSEVDESFWETEPQSLRRKFEARVKTAYEDGTIKRLSVFALAPQPLLILLGTLLPELVEGHVYAHHKEPKGWNWCKDGDALGFTVTKPRSRKR